MSAVYNHLCRSQDIAGSISSKQPRVLSEELSEVDCQSEANEQWVDGVNSQACEEMNSFINDRTVPSLEMTKGRYYVYWYALFRLKNERTTEQRGYARQRFRRGHIRQDPDIVVLKHKRVQVGRRAKI